MKKIFVINIDCNLFYLLISLFIYTESHVISRNKTLQLLYLIKNTFLYVRRKAGLQFTWLL